VSYPKAFSLVEALVVLTIGSTVLALSVGTVHQAMQVAEMAQANSQRTLHSNRFMEQFRNDVHLGVNMDLHSNQSLTIDAHDHSKIVYGIEQNSVTREQTASDGKISHDAILLSANAYGTLDFEEESKIVSLRIFTNLERHHAPPRLNRCVEAILGRTATSYTIEEQRP